MMTILSDHSKYVNDFNAEEQSRVWFDVLAHLSIAISIVGRADQISFASFLEANEALVPALDNLALAYDKVKRLAAIVACIELSAIGQSSPIVCLDLLSLLHWFT